MSLEGIPPRQGTDGYPVATDDPVLRLDGRAIARAHHHGIPMVLAPTVR
ncbi:MAG: hypothetical protein U0Q21_15705 [Dermatophilaceae bacterium]